MVSVDQVYMIGHMKNADGSINNKNVVLSAACEAAELFQCMMSVNQKLEDWQRFNHTLEMHLRSVECEKIHDKIGMKYEKTAVGDKYVYENMCKNNFSLGGEQSGHIIFSKHATTGDGILTSLMIMEVILEKKMSLSRLAEPVKIYPQLLQNVRVADKKTARENPEVIKAVDNVAR